MCLSFAKIYIPLEYRLELLHHSRAFDVYFNLNFLEDMKNSFAAMALILCLVVAIPAQVYAAPENEKAFVDAYKKAFESKDEATLKGFLYTKGADPTMQEFYTMMLTSDIGGKLTNIELRDLTAEEVKKATATQPLPDGGNAKLTLTPTKKLVLKIESSDANGKSSSSSETFVAELDGKYVIPVPGPVK